MTYTEKGRAGARKASGFAAVVKSDIHRNWTLYLLVLPVLAFYALFCYTPMYGALIAFKNYTPGVGFLDSPWVGFKHFTDFFASPDFFRISINTIKISVAALVFGFPAPIILALLMNELKNKFFKKTAQTITYLPHFISLVVICGMIKDFVSGKGVITSFIGMFTGQYTDLLGRAEAFIPIYVISDIWQGMGWGSIIYLAALSGIDTQLYEAAIIDGAGKWRQLWNITLPGLSSTIIIMLVLRIGGLLNVGFEKIILLYNPLIYSTSDVISSYVYRLGFEGQQWSFTTAIGLLNSVINFILLIAANWFSKKLGETALW